MVNLSYREIPEGSVEVQTGLWASEKRYISPVTGTEKMFYNVYSSEGYVFWEVAQPENYDEEGNLLPLEQRVFATFISSVCTTIEEVNEAFVSVPYQDGYEVVSVGNNTSTI